MWSAWIGIGSWPMQPGFPMQAGSGINAAPSQRPEKSGRPSGALGAGAFGFTAPLGSRGTPGVGYFTYCAATVADSKAVNSPRMNDRMARDDIIPPVPDNIRLPFTST